MVNDSRQWSKCRGVKNQSLFCQFSNSTGTYTRPRVCLQLPGHLNTNDGGRSNGRNSFPLLPITWSPVFECIKSHQPPTPHLAETWCTPPAYHWTIRTVGTGAPQVSHRGAPLLTFFLHQRMTAASIAARPAFGLTAPHRASMRRALREKPDARLVLTGMTQLTFINRNSPVGFWNQIGLSTAPIRDAILSAV